MGPKRDAPAPAPKPAVPEEIRIGIPSEGDTMDPAHFSLVYTFSIAVNVFSALVRYKVGTSDIEPDLAKSWEVGDLPPARQRQVARRLRHLDGAGRGGQLQAYSEP